MHVGGADVSLLSFLFHHLLLSLHLLPSLQFLLSLRLLLSLHYVLSVGLSIVPLHCLPPVLPLAHQCILLYLDWDFLQFHDEDTVVELLLVLLVLQMVGLPNLYLTYLSLVFLI